MADDDSTDAQPLRAGEVARRELLVEWDRRLEAASPGTRASLLDSLAADPPHLPTKEKLR